MTFGSLFAGVGGFDLGFERVGMTCKWQVEIDPFAQKVLAKHWSAVRRWDDVRTFPPEPIDDWRVDVICGGFPCQDISNAGLREGIAGPHSGLWSEFARIICNLRPHFIVVENVAALLDRGMGRVLGDLAALGFDAEWDCLPAAAFGADHFRDRLFLLAYPCGSGWSGILRGDEIDCPAPTAGRKTNALGLGRNRIERIEQGLGEPAVLGSPDGLSCQVERLRCIGNSVYVPIAEFIGRRLMEASRD